MHEIQVDVVEPESVERLVESVSHTSVVGVGELCRDEDLLAGHGGRNDGLANGRLVAVPRRSVEVSVFLLCDVRRATTRTNER